MNETDDVIGRALDLAKRGMAYEACECLWPLVRDEATRDEAVFTLAYCFEQANNLPTAAYLYGWVADHHPEFNVASRRLEKCRAAMEARGLHEEFSDSGHVDCACGTFRYRAELGLCPYCGKTPGEVDDTVAEPVVGDADRNEDEAKARSEEVLENVRRDLDRVWRSIQEKFDEFQQREGLSGPAHHAQILTREIADRAKKFSESETGQKLKEAAEQVRDRTGVQLRAAGERDDVQQARTRLEEWTRDAADRIEELARNERVQSAGRTAYETVERFVSRVQGYIDRMTGRDRSGVPDGRGPDEDPQADDPRDRDR